MKLKEMQANIPKEAKEYLTLGTVKGVSVWREARLRSVLMQPLVSP